MSRCSLGVMAILMCCATAGAQPLSPQQAAEARFKSGLKYYDGRDFESARLEFVQAYALLQKPEILRNLALSELYANRPLDALAHLRAYVADASVPAEKRERAKKSLDEAYAKTGHVKVLADAGASVSISGRTATVGEPVDVAAGMVSVVARAGDREQKRDVDAPAGKEVDADVRFAAKPAAPPLPTTQPPAVAPAAAPATVLSPPDKAEPRVSRSTAGWFIPASLGVAAVGSFAAGIGLAAASHGNASDANALASTGACAPRTNPPCAQLSDLVDSANSDSALSTVFYVGGAVFAVGSIATWFLLAPSEPARGSTRPSVTPSVGKGGAGVVVNVGF